MYEEVTKSRGGAEECSSTFPAAALAGEQDSVVGRRERRGRFVRATGPTAFP